MVVAIDRIASLRIAKVLFAWMISYLPAFSQSRPETPKAQATRELTYDTSLAGTGYNNYNLTFSKWDPRWGKLVAVRIRTKATVQFGYTLRNVDNQADSFSLMVGRKDTISCTALRAPHGFSISHKIGSFGLDSLNGQSKAPYVLLDDYGFEDSITDNLSSFTGLGYISFKFSPVTWSSVQSANQSRYFYDASILDTTRFSLSYIYESGLAARLVAFDASQKQAGAVQLTWSVANETTGRAYQIQVGRDGENFSSLDSISISKGDAETADYGSSFVPAAGAIGKWYFRILITDADNTKTNSEIREVEIGKLSETRLAFFPNPATDFTQIQFPGDGPQDWQVDVIDAGGQLLQRNYYSNVKMVTHYFQRKLSPGVYILKATEAGTLHSYVGSLVVQ